LTSGFLPGRQREENVIGDFKGKVAFVTGAASGIGLAIAQAFAEAKIKVMLADIEENALDVAVAALKASGAEVRGVVCDVSDRASVQRAAEETFAIFGKVHIVCSNAGVFAGGQMESIPAGDWDWVLGVNLMGAIYVIQAFLPNIKAHSEGGHIVITSSGSGMVCTPGTAPHNVSKFALVGLAETLAAELAGTSIGVSVLCPSFVRTRIATSVRNRPPRFGAQREQPAGANAQLEALVDAGTEPQKVARRVVMAIRDDDLYVFTHPELRGFVEERFGRIFAALDKSVTLQD
jgi:NAD(P)-dependent dehydrogenase (short-subunit alcohol dehydrogenase family)